MTSSEPQVISGLRDVLACESSVGFIDGQQGVLRYRGYDIHDFVESADFLDVVYLLWHGRWPTDEELTVFDQEVRTLRGLPPQVHQLLALLPLKTVNPMSVLRTAVSLRGALDEDEDAKSREAVLEKATGVLARLPTLVAALARLSQGKEPVEPDPELGHVANYLYMLHGERPSESHVQALNTTLNLYAEHELNASTFTTRVVVGALSDYYSAVVGGICALKGPLHGGAIDEAMKLFHEIGSVEAIDHYLDRALGQKRIISGFGHGVYRVRDPRAYHLDPIARRLAEESGDSSLYEIASRTEQEMLARKRLNANVDYYGALVLYYLGFPLNMFTSFIASSRIAGWTAHILEQYAGNRLIRPRTLYRGPSALVYTPREAR